MGEDPNRASMGDDYADGTNEGVSITDESPVEEIYENFNSNGELVIVIALMTLMRIMA